MKKAQVNMIFKVLLDTTDEENPFKNTLAKINKAGKYRLRHIDNEEIEGYSFLLITEYLTAVSMDYWNEMEEEQQEQDLLRYCMNGFKELSTSEGINIGVAYDKSNKTYHCLNHLNIDEPNLKENIPDPEYDDPKPTMLTKYIFETYMNEKHLTKSQLRFIDTFINNWVDEAGFIRDMQTNEILYTKQNVNYHKNAIFNKLNKLIEKDKMIKKTRSGRWSLF